MAELKQWYQELEHQPDFTKGLSHHAQQFLEDRLLAGIESRLSRSSEKPFRVSVPHPVFHSGHTRMYQIAAVFTGLLIVTAILYRYSWLPFNKNPDYQTVTLSTNYGVTRTIKLPDGSTVILNGNSALSYPKSWAEGQSREVELRGEAFFKVVHTSDHRRFKVRTADNFSVEVLGTEFTVSKRRQSTRVVLTTGRVQCNLKNKTGTDTLLLKPGELVELGNDPTRYTRKQVDPMLYSAWTQHKMIFKNTSLQEVATMLNETYGFTIGVEKPDLLNRRISGSLPTDNVDMLLEGIAEACRLHVNKKDRHIYLTDKPL
ncbi:FecR family protein [Larkinella arboricola]|nr:FecR domain-containing protein [Larkinella arboricola]